MSWDNSHYGNYNEQNYNSNYEKEQQEQQNYHNTYYQEYSNPEFNYENPQQSSYYNPNSYSQPPPLQQSIPGGNFMIPGGASALLDNPAVANMAMEYGNNMLDMGQQEIKKNLNRYISLAQLKYYFAVDNSYVGRKLGILLFPFARSEWSIKYHSSESVQPKCDINAPDLYIPSMAYMTYVLLVGFILGLQNTFSPDNLATTASSALVWLTIEILFIYLTMTLMNINSNLSKWDILSFSTYKYVAMVTLLLIGLFGSFPLYYISLVYTSLALMLFLLRTLNFRIEVEVGSVGVPHGKRKYYIILLYSGLQPFLIWWLTYSFILAN